MPYEPFFAHQSMKENDRIIKARHFKTYLLDENGKDIYSRPHLFIGSLVGGMKATVESASKCIPVPDHIQHVLNSRMPCGHTELCPWPVYKKPQFSPSLSSIIPLQHSPSAVIPRLSCSPSSHSLIVARFFVTHLPDTTTITFVYSQDKNKFKHSK